MTPRMLVLLVMIVALLGCQKRSVVGTWDIKAPVMPGVPGMASATATFGADKSIVHTFDMGASMGMPALSMSMGGTYEVQDDTITITWDLDQFQISGMPEAPAEFKEVAKEFPPTETGTLTFVSADEFTITFQGDSHAIAYARAKQ